jgi:hypothetical protein
VNANKGIMLEEPPPREEVKREEVNANKGVTPKASSAMTKAIMVMAGLLLLVGLTLAGLFALGYMQQQQAAQDKAGQALQEQRQANEDLQKQLEDVQAKQDAQEKADLQKQIDQLKSDRQTHQPVVIENNENVTAQPSQAGPGTVGVSPDFNSGALDTSGQGVLNAAVGYYQAAEVGDYETTWNMLSFEDQANYPLSDWIYANTQLDTQAAEFVVTDVWPTDAVTASRPRYRFLTEATSPGPPSS